MRLVASFDLSAHALGIDDTGTDTVGDDFLSNIQSDFALRRIHGAAANRVGADTTRPAPHRAGGVAVVQRPAHQWGAARLAGPHADVITEEAPLPATTAPIASATPVAVSPPVIGTTDLQLDVRAATIKKFGDAILLYFGMTTGLFGQPIEQKPRPGKLRVDMTTGRLITSRNATTGPTLEINLLINPFTNRVNLDPTQKGDFEASALADADTRAFYTSILALDGMAILGHPNDTVDPTLAAATPSELVKLNKVTLSALVESSGAMTIELGGDDADMGMMDATNVRIYFAPDGSISRADAKTAGVELASTHSKGLGNSLNYVDVAMSGNAILAHGDLSNLTPRQVSAFLALYQNPEMVSQREDLEGRYPGLGQRIMTTAAH